MQSKPFEERFWKSACRIDGSDTCWPWTAKCTTIVDDQGKQVTAHCASFRINIGPVPTGMRVTQSCGNRRCVRPTHLLLSSHGRQGSAHHGAKLTEVKVLLLMRDLNDGMPPRMAAKKYGVAEGTISNIRCRKTWRHVKPVELPPRVAKSRARTPGARTRKRKLTPEQVREIRRREENDELVGSLADEFGQCSSSISKICSRRTYKDVV